MGRTLRTALAATCSAVIASAALAGIAATPAAATTLSDPAASGAAASDAVDQAAAAAAAPCDVTVTVIAQWSTGFGAQLTIRNVSTAPVRWHRIDVWFAGPVWSMQGWNAVGTQTGSQATFAPLPSGGLLNPGQAISIGAVYASGNPATLAKPLVDCAPA